MLVKGFTIITIFITVCMGEILPKLSPERSNSQASSSVNFHRQDVPLTYQYSALHPQASTTKDEHKSHGYQQRQNLNPDNYRIIQYAPLIKPGELRLQNTKFNKAYLHNPEKLLDPTKFTFDETPTPNIIKKPLEPREEELPSASPAMDNKHNLRGHSMPHLDYIPGHNIEVLRSVNRYPAHNAVYRSYTDRIPINDVEKQKFNYLNQYYIHPNQRDNDYSTTFKVHVDSTKVTTPKTTTPNSTTASSTTTTTTTTTHSTPKPYKIPYETPKQYYIPKPITYIVEKPITGPRAPYTKMHSLLLNVARAYSLSMGPHKNQHTGNNPNFLGQIQNFGLTNRNYNHQPLMKVPGSKLNVPHLDQKTVLYPVQKNINYAI